jgi:hypothetical protein
MKKLTILTLLFLVTSFTVKAQFSSKKVKGDGNISTDIRTVTDYQKIGIVGNFDVELVKGTEGKITIIADKNLMEYIITEVKDGSLKVKPKKKHYLKPTEQIKITITFDNIDALSLAGSGDIFSDDLINSNEFKLSVAGSGDASLKIDAELLKTSVAGSGNIKLVGSSNELKCSVAGSGNINAYDLKANVVKASTAGSGNIKVHANNEIHASSAGSGNIYYTGNPEIEKSKSVGSGSIKNKS